MQPPFIQTLIPHLPRYAEEEGDFYAVPRTALVDALCQTQIGLATAETVITLVESLLDTLAVLDTDYLQKGEWCWVSFPAQLLATSVLTAWGDPNSRFFAANFWNTQGIADAKKNQQREVLQIVESRRYGHHANHAATPIRYIYVAWGIVKIEGKVLLYQREDTEKRHDKQAGDYGLVGGRLNQCDVVGKWEMRELLAVLQSANSPVLTAALPETLKREISEETGLDFNLHYQFKPWRCLQPYQQVQGSAPNHALTQYHLELFSVDLTLDGYLFLQQQLRQNERLAWFTLDELAQGETADGRIGYIKALLADFGHDQQALKTALSELPDSFTASYRVNKTKYGMTFLLNDEKPILAGILGKERPLDKVLTASQTALLLGLAAHNRRFEFATVTEGVVFHPYGWVDVGNNPALQTQLMALAAMFKGTDVCIENHQDVLFRLSVNPALVYFDEALFEFALQQADLIGSNTKIPANLTRQAFKTAFGDTAAQQETFVITLELADKLRKLSEKAFASDHGDAVKTEDTCNKGIHKEPKFLALGLRRLLRRDSGTMKFCCRFNIG